MLRAVTPCLHADQHWTLHIEHVPLSAAWPTLGNTNLLVHLPVRLLVLFTAVPHNHAPPTSLDRVRLATYFARYDLQRSPRLRNPSPQAFSHKLRHHVLHLLACL